MHIATLRVTIPALLLLVCWTTTGFGENAFHISVPATLTSLNNPNCFETNGSHCAEASTTEEPGICLTSISPGVNQSLCKDTNMHMYLCEGYNPAGTQFTLWWLFNREILDKSFTPDDDVSTSDVQNFLSYQLIPVLTKKSLQTTSTNGTCVDFASVLIVQSLWNHNHTQLSFNVSCKITISSDNNTTAHTDNQSSYHKVEDVKLEAITLHCKLYVREDLTILNATWNVTLTNKSNVDLIAYNVTFDGKQKSKSSVIHVDRDFEKVMQKEAVFLTNEGTKNYNVTVTAKDKCGQTIPNATNTTVCVVDSSSNRLCYSALSTVAILCVAIMARIAI